MFYFGYKCRFPIIKPELNNYIKKSLVNSLKEIKENYSDNNKKYNIDNILKNIYNSPENLLTNKSFTYKSSPYISSSNTNNTFPYYIYCIIPFVSLISFFAGYNFRNNFIKTIS